MSHRHDDLHEGPAHGVSVSTVALTMLLALIVSAFPPAVPTAAETGPLKVVLGSEPLSLDPSVDTNKVSMVITATMLEPLALNTPEQTFKPWLAESWTSSGNKWRIKLKQGVKFHNGEPLNADAVLFSHNVWVTTKGTGRGYFNSIVAAEKVDDLTVDFVTKEASTIVPASLGFFYVFPPKYYTQVGPQGFGKSPIGTGPWRFVEWAPGVQLKVTAYPDYWGKKPAISDIHFRWAPDASSRVALLETGEVHLAQNIPPALADRVERSGTARLEAVRSMRYIFLQFNLTAPPTSDVRVRRAINHAIDVESIIRVLYRGRAYGRFKGFIHEGFEGYQGDQLKPFAYDPELAKRLLVEAGYPNGMDLEFWHVTGRYQLDKEASEAIAGQLAKVGIRVKLTGMESGAYFRKLSTEKAPGMNYIGCAPTFNHPVSCTLSFLSSMNPLAYGATRQTDDYIKRISAELNDAKRVQLLREFENYISSDLVPWVWLWYQQDLYGASNKVNWKPRSDEFISFETASFR